MLSRFLLSLLLLGAAAPAAQAKQCGEASFYGYEHHGMRTANGERFDANAMTAAHRSLPFGTRLRITNQNNGKSVVIRVNDYGPTIPSRIIDLSLGAFASIASPSSGLAKVCMTKL
jgi:rare lipoprotein A